MLFILCAILSFIVSSAVHELGHILIGLKEGFKFYLLIAGPFGLKRNDKDKIVFYIEKNISLWGGLSVTIPENENENTRAVEIAIWNLTQNYIIQGNYKKANYDQIMILINDKDVRAKYLGHYYAYNFYKDNNDISNIDKEKSELESLKGKVPKQMVSMFDIQN